MISFTPMTLLLVLCTVLTKAQSTPSLSGSPTVTLVGRQESPSPTDSGILEYDPSAGNYAVGAIFAIYTVVITMYIWRRKDRWAICLPIGTLCSGVGYLIRPSMTRANTSVALYAVQQFLVVISPCAFLAFNYLLYGRMILAVDADFGKADLDEEALQSSTLTAGQKLTMIHKAGGPKREKSRFSFIPPRIVGRVFVWSDVVTFLIQCAAGGMQASGGSNNPNLTEIGDKLFLAGVILQGISYILFTILITYATIKVVREGSGSSHSPHRRIFGLDAPVFGIVAGLYLSSLFIIVSGCTSCSKRTTTLTPIILSRFVPSTVSSSSLRATLAT